MARRVRCEKAPAFAQRFGRRTGRRFGHARSAARIARWRAMRTSGHTLLQNCDAPRNSEPAGQRCRRSEQHRFKPRGRDRTALWLRHGAATVTGDRRDKAFKNKPNGISEGDRRGVARRARHSCCPERIVYRARFPAENGGRPWGKLRLLSPRVQRNRRMQGPVIVRSLTRGY